MAMFVVAPMPAPTTAAANIRFNFSIELLLQYLDLCVHNAQFVGAQEAPNRQKEQIKLGTYLDRNRRAKLLFIPDATSARNFAVDPRTLEVTIRLSKPEPPG
jgi:hypothetical protein